MIYNTEFDNELYKPIILKFLKVINHLQYIDYKSTRRKNSDGEKTMAINKHRTKQQNQFRTALNILFRKHEVFSFIFHIGGYRVEEDSHYDHEPESRLFQVLLPIDFLESWIGELIFDILYESELNLESFPWVFMAKKHLEYDKIEFPPDFAPPWSLLDYCNQEWKIVMTYPQLYSVEFKMYDTWDDYYNEVL